MDNGLIKKLEAAKEDKHGLNTLLGEYLPFIKKCVAGVFYQGQSRQDALTDGMLAFLHAVETYTEQNGAFINYAARVIRNRIIDIARKEYKTEQPLIAFSALEEADAAGWEYGIAQRKYETEESERNIDTELAELNKEFLAWGFDWKKILKNCPKQIRSRRSCCFIARQIAEDERLVSRMLAARQLPIKELEITLGFSRKIFEKYRQYIAALIIIMKGDYPYIRAFLPRFFDEEHIL